MGELRAFVGRPHFSLRKSDGTDVTLKGRTVPGVEVVLFAITPQRRMNQLMRKRAGHIKRRSYLRPETRTVDPDAIRTLLVAVPIRYTHQGVLQISDDYWNRLWTQPKWCQQFVYNFRTQQIRYALRAEYVKHWLGVEHTIHSASPA